MRFQFPDSAKGSFTQTNRGNILGTFWSSMALDLQSNLGIVRIAQRLRISTDTTDDSDLGLPIAFEPWDGIIMALCGTKPFKSGTTPNATFTEDTSSGAPSDFSAASDLGIFSNKLWATSDTALWSKALGGGGTGAWTSRDTISGSATAPVTPFVKFPRLYYVSNSLDDISSIDAANIVSAPGAGVDYAINLTGEGLIGCLDSNSTYIWIGMNATPTRVGLQGSVLQWDGISPQIIERFPVKNARYIYALCVKNDIPFCIDQNGVLSKYNGYAFEEVGRLPFGPLLTGTTLSIKKNGMIVTKNDTILVVVNNVNAGSTASYNENNYSGVWEWSEEFGFVQKFVFTYNKNGSATITDFGQNQILSAGAICDVGNFSPSVANTNGQFLVGSTYYYDATNTRSGIFFDDTTNTLQKKGYFVTTWWFSDEVQSKWAHLYAMFRRLLDSTDRIVLKYRINEADPLYADIIWTSTTTFTTTTNPSAYWTEGIGGEVEILRGKGGGLCAHITSIVNNAGTYTVTIDTIATGVVNTDTAKARFQHWVKMNEEISAQINSFQQLSVAGNTVNPANYGTRIQLKCCMTFTGNGELHKLAMKSNEDIKIDI